jgi:hypothetical protein
MGLGDIKIVRSSTTYLFFNCNKAKIKKARPHP